jgi:hypothetical protein
MAPGAFCPRRIAEAILSSFRYLSRMSDDAPRTPRSVGRSSFNAAILAFAVLLFISSPVRAQKPREIGRTAANNPVLVEPRTVKREGALLHATIRVKFAKAVRAPGGDWWSSRTRLTFDCTKRTVAILENWYYGDTTWTRVTSHNVVGQPGYGTVMGGSMTSVGYDSLCPAQ